MKIMGNSGWCLSKNVEVEYRHGEDHHSSNSRLKVEQQDVKMSLKLANNDSIAQPLNDKKALKVSSPLKTFHETSFLSTLDKRFPIDGKS